MMRCFSSAFDATRMWRRTERAIFEKKPSMRLSHEPCFKDEAEAALGPRGKPLVGFLRHVRRMIVQDDLDRGVGRVGGIELFEKADEFARAVAVFDAGMNLPGEQVNPREQAQRPVALVFMVAR